MTSSGLLSDIKKKPIVLLAVIALHFVLIVLLGVNLISSTVHHPASVVKKTVKAVVVDVAKMEAEDQAAETESTRLQDLKEQLQSCQDKIDSLNKSGETQYSSTDKDARLLIKKTDKGPTAGYSLHIAVDEKNKLSIFIYI